MMSVCVKFLYKRLFSLLRNEAKHGVEVNLAMFNKVFSRLTDLDQ